MPMVNQNQAMTHKAAVRYIFFAVWFSVCRLQTKTLRLSYLQDALGDAVFMDAARGKNPYLFAALKSLPLADEEPQQQQQQQQEGEEEWEPQEQQQEEEEKPQQQQQQQQEEEVVSGKAGAGTEGGGEDGAGPEGVLGGGEVGGKQAALATAGEQELATALLGQVDAEVDSCSTSLKEDEELLLDLLGRGSRVGGFGEVAAEVAGDGSPGEEDGVDVRLVAAVRYRVERKRLLQATQSLLGLFLR